MSWSLSFNSLAALDRDEPSWGTVPEDARDQYEAARVAALDLIASGAVGGVGEDYNVSISGHANPEHEPRDGYANDCIAINVSQKIREKVNEQVTESVTT